METMRERAGERWLSGEAEVVEGREAATRLTRRASTRVCDRFAHVTWGVCVYFVVTRDKSSHVVGVGGRFLVATLELAAARSLFPGFHRVQSVSFIDALLPYYIRPPSSVRDIRKHMTCSNFTALSSASRAASDLPGCHVDSPCN